MNQIKKTEDPKCLDILEDATTQEPGILSADLDTVNEKILLEFNPAAITEEKIQEIIHKVTPELRSRWDSCTMRLERKGGRACESCALRLEQKLSQIPGVHRATASYLGGSLTIDFDHQTTNKSELTNQVSALGIPAIPLEIEQKVQAAPDILSPAEKTLKWLGTNLEAVLSGVTLVAMLTGLAFDQVAGGETAAIIAYIVAYLAGGYYGTKGGLASLREWTIDIDLLMILAALGAAVVGEPFEGAMLLFLFSLSNVLQDFAIGKTRSAIQALMKLRPTQALVRRGSHLTILPIEQIVVGDRLIVRPGERIPLDGEIISGESAIDQSPITGESMPVNKSTGDKVIAGTINQQGALEIKVNKLAKESTIARLIQLVEEAQSRKAQTQRIIDVGEQYYAVGVIAATFLAIVIPIFFLNEAFSTAFYRAMTLMVAASPCALVISTPATVLSAIGNGARRGVLFKGGVYVEQAASLKAIAFDKTGTLTVGQPRVTDVQPLHSMPGEEITQIAASVESHSEHPLAKAITNHAKNLNIPIFEPSQFTAEVGKGAWAVIQGRLFFVGNLKALHSYQITHLEQAQKALTALQEKGKTAVVLGEVLEEGNLLIVHGTIGIADVIKADAPAVIQKLRELGIRTIMLTGDNARVGKAIGAQVGVDEVHADLMPEDKVRILEETQKKYGPIAMIGDGVNDAPALAAATIGIAMGAAGTDVALETADVVLMADDLKNLPYVISLSQQTWKTLAINLGFSLFMIVVMIVGIFWVALPLPLAVIGHEGGTVLVSLNGLRMLFYKPK